MRCTALLVGFIYLMAVLPITASADGPRSMSGVVRVAAADGLLLPPQEEGKLDAPEVLSKPWYKKWWVWTIIIGLAAGGAGGAGAGG